MLTTPRKPSSCLDLKNQRKKSAKTRKLGFLKNDCAWGGEDNRKPTKNQGENQGSRKPSVLVGFLRQKKGLCIPSQSSAQVVQDCSVFERKKNHISSFI